MAYNRLPDNLPEILKSHGLKVRQVPGWRKRGRPASTGGFNPVGVLCHHTATTVAWTLAAVIRLLTGGRTNLPGPLAQLGLTRKGVVWIIASGRANHAGKAKASGSVAAGDGNELYIGIEAFNNGTGEPWPDVQYKAYVLLAAVLSVKITKNSARTVRGHRETSTTGKIDPTFDMDRFREHVAVKMDDLTKKKPTFSRGGRVDHALDDLYKSKAKPGSHRDKKIKAAIKTLKEIHKIAPKKKVAGK